MKRKSCEYSSKVSAFADHELLLTEGSAFENHLKTCSACSAELEQVNYVRDRLRLLKTPDLPSPLPMRVDLGSKPARLTLKEIFGRRISIPVPVALLMVAGYWRPLCSWHSVPNSRPKRPLSGSRSQSNEWLFR